MKVINTHIDNADVCEVGCGALWNITTVNTSLQIEVCKKGGLIVLLKVLSRHTGNVHLLSMCCGAIGTVLSPLKIYSKPFMPDVIRAVEECYEKHKDSGIIKHTLLSLKREEDPRVHDAVANNMCTKEAFPKCSESCDCEENVYCPKCCVQQRAFRCLTCDKDNVRLYCEVCWMRDHQGHKGEEFFYPVRCATGHKQ